MREIDALGGEMGKAADRTEIQSRMLNRGKGPAVHSLRAQIDRREYAKYMKHALERQECLDVRQAEVIDLYRADGGLWTLKTRLEAVYSAKCVVLATGTFLGGRIYIGDVSYESGPDGMFPATALSAALKRLHIPLRRFKDRHARARQPPQRGFFRHGGPERATKRPCPFPFDTETPPENKADCYITYTNDATKQVILDNIDSSPLYGGKIHGVGPRYCPSFEDKVMRFPDKERHQLFVEPCGLDTEEMYLQGMSSSLPEAVQLQFLRTIPGLGARGDHAHRLRDRIRLRRPARALAVTGIFRFGGLCSARGSSTARPAMKRRRRRG